MKIKSDYKDFYDYVAHVYGGGDEKVTYVRNRINPIHPTDAYPDRNIRYDTNEVDGFPYHIGSYSRSDSIQFKWLVFCGKYYLLVGYRPEFGFTKYHILNDTDTEFLAAILYRKRDWLNRYYKISIEDFCGVPSNELVAISKKIHQPVYIINAVYHKYIEIENRIPNLGELGFGSIMTGEQTYQEIAYYISNIMVESPDIKPPTEVSNEQRIIQYGFDIKHSFRHRK